MRVYIMRAEFCMKFYAAVKQEKYTLCHQGLFKIRLKMTKLQYAVLTKTTPISQRSKEGVTFYVHPV